MNVQSICPMHCSKTREHLAHLAALYWRFRPSFSADSHNTFRQIHRNRCSRTTSNGTTSTLDVPWQFSVHYRVLFLQINHSFFAFHWRANFVHQRVHFVQDLSFWWKRSKCLRHTISWKKKTSALTMHGYLDASMLLPTHAESNLTDEVIVVLFLAQLTCSLLCAVKK